MAPAVRVAIGELFGQKPGTDCTGKLVTALKKLGFDGVFDTNFAADITIMEEATELKHRLEENKKLPLFTSCCPSWVRFAELNYPEILDNVSSTKSPQQIFGSLAKNVWAEKMGIDRKNLVSWVRFAELNYPEILDNVSSTKSPQQIFGSLAKNVWAEKMGIDRKNLVCVSIMPCISKKYEASREELAVDENPDVDYSLTTRELGRIFKQYNIDFNSLADSDFDSPMGDSTGAADIFGRTGGVMEAAARTLYEWVANEKLDNLDFTPLRGFEEVRTAEVKIGDKNLRLAVVHGLRAARKVVEKILAGEEEFHAIEVMACKGGCIGGGGQPYHLRLAVVHGLRAARKVVEKILAGEEEFHAIEVMACKGGCIGGGGQPYHHGNFDIIKTRAEAIQNLDYHKEIRASHKNPYVVELYEKELGEPYGEKAHKIFHTHYVDRKIK